MNSAENIEPEIDYEEDVENSDVESLDEGELNPAPSPHKKVVLDKADRSLSELYRWYKSGRIIIDPEWQRNYVWDLSRASKLIESFLLDIPVPVVYFAKIDSGKYEVIDGLQRLTSVFNFFDNKYKLQRLDLLSEYKGKGFNDLPTEVQNKLEDSILRSFELSDSHGDIHFVVFERLNTGGIKLNDMEIRNCLYRGSLNSLIKDLAKNENFKKAVNQRNFEKRMQDRALILRFLAFYERTHLKCTSGLKRFLNDFLDTYKDAKEDKILEYRRAFEKSMRACLTVFGDNSFRLKSDIAKPGKFSSGEWATRPNAVIFQVMATSFSMYDIGQVTQKADSIYESYLDLINTDPVWVDRVRRATGESTRLKYVFDTWLQRLSEIMQNSESQDVQRVFSRRLKKEMFEANPTCSICGNKISLIDDAAMDHDVRYWLGGKTIPENARLTHRLCNQKKG
ncbi:MAG: HNH endonuclease family protein [Burkholderiaceae bacterium]